VDDRQNGRMAGGEPWLAGGPAGSRPSVEIMVFFGNVHVEKKLAGLFGACRRVPKNTKRRAHPPAKGRNPRFGMLFAFSSRHWWS
jgi:hypothetical protein